MRELTAVIIDDEADSRSVLKKLLKTFCPHVTVTGEAGNVKNAYELILQLKPDVIFLDIQMPGDNGFSLLKKFDEVPFDVIFVTSYDQYAIEAIKLSALDYLMKPVEVTDLKQAIDRLEKSALRKEIQQQQLVNLLFNLEGDEFEKRMTVHYNDKVKLLTIMEITYLESERNYTTIHTLKKEHYNSSKNLGEFEMLFETYPQFFRIGKSCIVNLNHVVDYSKGEPCIIELVNGKKFEITRRKKQEMLERLKR